MPGDINGLILLAFQAGVFVAAVVVVHSRPLAGIPIALGAGLAGYWTSAPLAHVGLIAVYPGDAASGVLLAATAIGLATRRARPGHAGWWWLFLSLGVIAFLRGASLYGLESAGLASRGIFWFVAPVLLFGTRVDLRDEVNSLRRWWVRAAWVLAVVAGLFWMRHGLGTFAVSGERALTSAQALLVAQSVFLVMIQRRPALLPTVRGWLLPLVGVGMIVLTQQRTVWVVAAVSVALLVVSRRLARPALRRRIRVAVGISVVCLGAIILIGPASLQASLVRATSEPVSGVSTLNWRLQGWGAILEGRQTAPLVDVLIGQPAGEGFSRVIGGGRVEVSPHNQYVATFVGLGALGLGAFLAGYLVIIRGLRRRAREGHDAMDELALRVLILGQLVFFLAYQVSLEQGVVAGLAYGLATRSRDQKRSSPARQRRVLEKVTAGESHR